jgi:hypothetical protein
MIPGRLVNAIAVGLAFAKGVRTAVGSFRRSELIMRDRSPKCLAAACAEQALKQRGIDTSNG